MQVHAVPDSERAIDSTGRRLPWGYDFGDPDQNQRRVPEEKGPFGKARKRGTSRAKTPTTKTAEDNAKLENLRVQDDIFGRFKAEEDKRRSVSGALPSSGALNLIEAGTSFPTGAATNTSAKEPKEVILYGFGTDVQWAAIDHYEKVSNGLIYEEYDRDPFNQKFNYAFASQRASNRQFLSKDALLRINQYIGGNHWIRVTFDSAEAAERACHYSPKVLQGYTVFAEPYRGTGPTGGDREIRAAVGSITSLTTSPGTVSSWTTGPGASQSSTTVSSATATASIPASSSRLSQSTITRPTGAFPTDLAAPQSLQSQALASTTATATTTALYPASRRATLRLKGANVKPAVFLPQEKAFLPVAPRWQQTLGALPIIGWLVGSGQDQVPRKEDGSFDVQSASLYWRAWYAVDACFGSDFCGVREGEYDD
ncbi:hypothetical protein P153DRAFT_365761 [Dothidotthia symphoricarpi CBS 119687]|uniref:Uncharacterized protein n=1 Tax=Dothidotthia symphoricarpi CBS 119687 TaxID=1392245 RepID=A0A6A6AJS4_9PLEO|nr:uncharacterized protein P153DRAFT_365761 [Dothidotthia symphoricarpi CBS 119687]KAF2131164.1 hypothetical protein P153DRAFT_365761 [Dothidotthia symphoricarpi CBS 119687]